MQKYNHLNLSARYCIQQLIQDHKSQTEIARILGVHRSTISRELKRNVGKRGIGTNSYCANNAFRRAKVRQVNKPKLFRLTDSLKRDARLWLSKETLSPELIAARWRKLGVDGVSYETLYTWIWEAKKSKPKTWLETKCSI